MLSLFTCASRSWRERRDVVLGTVRQIVSSRGAEGPLVKLDDASLQGVRNAGDPASHRFVELKDLLRPSTDAYEPDTHAITRLLVGLSSDTVLVLDAGAFPYHAVSKTLWQFRITMFTMLEWPAAVLLIVGEEALESATGELAATFYVLPRRKSMAEASVHAYQVHRIASYARMFGRGFNLSKSVERFKRKKLKRDEDDFYLKDS